DIAGTVDGIGPGVRGVADGDEVVCNPGVSCGRCRDCLSGHDNLCRDYGILGEHRDGGYARYVVVPAQNLLAAPRNLTPVERAAQHLAATGGEAPMERLLARVREICGKRGVDVVFEHTGAATWPTSILACARGGRIVTCGATSGYAAQTDLRHVFFRQITIYG